MKILKNNKIDGGIYPSETVFILEGLEGEDKELGFKGIKEIIFKNADKIKYLKIISKYFEYKDLSLCLMFDNFEYSSYLLSVSKTNEEIEIRKGTTTIKFPEVFGFDFFPFIQEEEMEIFKIIQLIDNNLIIKKEENFVEFYYKGNLVLASNNFVIKAVKSQESNGEYQIIDFKFNKNFKPFEMTKKLNLCSNFEISNEKFTLLDMPYNTEYFSFYNKWQEGYILEFSIDYEQNSFKRLETNPVERFGLNQYNSLPIVVEMLENLQCFVIENNKKMIQDWIEVIKKQIQEDSQSFNEFKLNENFERILNNLKNIF